MYKYFVLATAAMVLSLPAQPVGAQDYRFAVPIDIKNVHELAPALYVSCEVFGNDLSGRPYRVKSYLDPRVPIDQYTGNALSTQVTVSVSINKSQADPRDINRYSCRLVNSGASGSSPTFADPVMRPNAAGTPVKVQVGDPTKPKMIRVGGTITNP